MASHSLDLVEPEDLGDGLAQVNPEDARVFVANNIVESPPAPPPTVRHTPEINDIRAGLESFKEQFGGAPNYADGNPRHEEVSKKFFGIPIESCRAWSQKTLDKGWFPSSLWKAVARGFGVATEGTRVSTRFETHALHLDSVRRMDANRDIIAAAFRSGVGPGEESFSSLTRLACHASSNGGAEGMISAIDNYLAMFKTYYQAARQAGPEALNEFFDAACRGVCFENRATRLTNYAETHMHLLEPEGADGTGAVGLNMSAVADHQENDTFIDAIGRERAVLAGQEPPASLKDTCRHLLQTLIGREKIQMNPDDLSEPLLDAETRQPVRERITADNLKPVLRYIVEVVDFEDWDEDAFQEAASEVAAMG